MDEEQEEEEEEQEEEEEDGTWEMVRKKQKPSRPGKTWLGSRSVSRRDPRRWDLAFTLNMHSAKYSISLETSSAPRGPGAENGVNNIS